MTNDEIRMTNQIRNPKSERNTKFEMRRLKATSNRRFVQISGFGFLSNFVIRISSLSRNARIDCCDIMNDVRFALRQLLKQPGFAVVAVLLLAPGNVGRA